MRKRDYFIVAKSLNRHIRNYHVAAGSHMKNDEFMRLRANADCATSLARYLGEHLTLSPNDRAMFLELCGLRSSI